MRSTVCLCLFAWFVGKLSVNKIEELGASLNRTFELFVLWHCHSLMPATAWTPAPCRWHVWMYRFCMGMRCIEDMSVGSACLCAQKKCGNRCFNRTLWIIIHSHLFFFFREFVRHSLYSVCIKSLHKCWVILMNVAYLMCNYFEWYIIAHFYCCNELVTSHIFNMSIVI